MVALSDNVLGRGQLPGVGGRETEGTKQAPRFAAGAVPSAAQHFVEQYADAYGNTLVFIAPGADGVWFTDDDVQSDYGANEIIYCGYRFDPETQLYYVRNRTYNPVLGRWIQRDPIGYNGGINLYGYVGGLAAAQTDLSGFGGRTLLPPGGVWVGGGTGIIYRHGVPFPNNNNTGNANPRWRPSSYNDCLSCWLVPFDMLAVQTGATVAFLSGFSLLVAPEFSFAEVAAFFGDVAGVAGVFSDLVEDAEACEKCNPCASNISKMRDDVKTAGHTLKKLHDLEKKVKDIFEDLGKIVRFGLG